MTVADVRANGPIVFTTTAGAAIRICVSSESNDPEMTSTPPSPLAVDASRAASRPARTTVWPASIKRLAMPARTARSHPAPRWRRSRLRLEIGTVFDVVEQ
jgi:hypothetical protein